MFRDDYQHTLLAGLLCDRDGAEETVGIVTRAGGEEELIGRSVGRCTLSELNSPYLVYLDGLALGISKRPQEFPRLWIEGVDPTPGGVVTDENRVAHGAKFTGSLRNAPGRMKGAMDREMFDQVAGGIEDVDESALGFIEGRKGHPDLTIDGLNPIRSKALWDVWIAERLYKVE